MHTSHWCGLSSESHHHIADFTFAGGLPALINFSQEGDPIMTTNDTTTVEARVRRARRTALVQGLRVFKSRCRDPRADDYGLYILRTECAGDRFPGAQGPRSDFARGHGMTLADIEQQLRIGQTEEFSR